MQAGVDYDVRVAKPYSRYEEFEFDIPVGTTGDCYDRFLVRGQEMWQSLSIIKQAIAKIDASEGEEATQYHADAPDFYLPLKERCLHKNGSVNLSLQNYYGRGRYAKRRNSIIQ